MKDNKQIKNNILFKPLWVVGHICILIIVIVCLFCSNWQFNRLSERKKINNQIIAKSNKSDLNCKKIEKEKDVIYRNFKDKLILEKQIYFIRGRSLEELPGLAVFVIGKCTPTSNFKLIINIGWVPLEADNILKDKYELTKNELVIKTQILPTESRNFLQKADIKSDLPFLSLFSTKTISKLLKIKSPNFYFVSENKILDGAKVFPKQIPTEKNHLSYAIQWLGFAITAIVIWIINCYKIVKKSKKTHKVL